MTALRSDSLIWSGVTPRSTNCWQCRRRGVRALDRRPVQAQWVESFRTVLPGGSEQALHVDVAVGSADWPLVGFIIMVDDFLAENGATRFVPGSHRWTVERNDATSNQRLDHPQQVVAGGTAGSAILFNGSTWHGHGANITNTPRRSIQGAYVPARGTCAEDWRSLSPQSLAACRFAPKSPRYPMTGAGR